MPDATTDATTRKPWLRERIARWIAPAAGAVPSLPAGAVPFKQARMYAGARNTQTTLGFGQGGATSADMELSTSLPMLRARSRQMLRDSAYAKRAQTIVVNNVIGSGMGLQSQVGSTRNALNERLNTAIEAAWTEWCTADQCHTGGAVHFGDLERLAMAEVFEAGEVLLRMRMARFGTSRVPLALEIIEPERLATEMVDAEALLDTGNDLRMGVEVDRHGRAAAYWLRREHPGDLRVRSPQMDGRALYERVPAAEIFHLRVVKRWPQTRGEPWLHAVLRKLDAMNEYSQSEVDAARASAAYFGTITSDSEAPATAQADSEDEAPVMHIDPLTVQQLAPGEKFDFHSPNRPNTALDPFMRAMLREIAAGTGPSYESLSRDYSQSNYSSSRLALLDDRDLWRQLQQWWIRAFRAPLHKVWVQQAVLGGAVQGLQASQYAADPAKFEAVMFKPRGWSWVDPTKEVAAYKEAIKGGLTTLSDVIAATAGGQDIEDMVATRRRELDMLAEAGIEVDTTVAEPVAPVAPVAAAPDDKADDKADDTEDDDKAEQAARVLDLLRGVERLAGVTDGLGKASAAADARVNVVLSGIEQLREDVSAQRARAAAHEAKSSADREFLRAQVATQQAAIERIDATLDATSDQIDAIGRDVALLVAASAADGLQPTQKLDEKEPSE